MNELKFSIPKEMVEVLSRYHDGNQNISNENRAKGWFLMQKLNDDYDKYHKKLYYLLDIEWDEKKIEEHYCDNIFKNAHKRLNNYETKLNDIHRKMFFLLTKFDKINSPFIKGEIISAKEIYLDFKDKYVDKIKEDGIKQKNGNKENTNHEH